MAFIAQIKEKLSKRFKMTDLGPSKRYLGMEVERNAKLHTVTLTQTAAIEGLLKAQGMQDCKPASTPMDAGEKLMKSEDGWMAGGP